LNASVAQFPVFKITGWKVERLLKKDETVNQLMEIRRSQVQDFTNENPARGALFFLKFLVFVSFAG